MSAVIPGINLPEYCYDCPCHNGEHGYCQISKDYIMGIERPAKCPLIPVPPHGRLIDADAYESLLRGIGNREYRREIGTICDAIKFLHPHYAPTIIPAEEEDNDRT